MDWNVVQEWNPTVLLNHRQPWLSTVLVLLGFLSIARFVLKTLSVLAQIFIFSGRNLKEFGAGNGSWAVVTGASDGIGREFALQLAHAGFNIVLVARDRERLAATAAQIDERCKSRVSTKIHLIDFTKDGQEAYKSFALTCEGLDIGVLVNNVGKSHATPVYFIDTPRQEMDDIVTVNINGTLRMTKIVLDGMVARKRGLILNVGSFAGSVPSPMLATYSGSKAFLATFTSALAEEVKPHNIVVENLNTYFVVSKLSKIRKPSALVPTPSAYVRSALSKIGLPCGAAYSGRPNNSTPFWTHAILDYAMTVIGCKGMFIRYTHGAHLKLWRRAQKKQRDLLTKAD